MPRVKKKKKLGEAKALGRQRCTTPHIVSTAFIFNPSTGRLGLSGSTHSRIINSLPH